MMRSTPCTPLLFACCMLVLTPGARGAEDTAATLREQFRTLREKAKGFEKQKHFDDARRAYLEMRAAYAAMAADPQVSKSQKLGAGLIVVQSWIAEGEDRRALDLCQSLFALPAVSPSDRVRIKCAVADIYRSQGLYGRTVEEYEKALALPGIGKEDQLYAYGKLAALHFWQDRNPEKAKKVVERMLPLTGNSGHMNGWLRRLATFRAPKTSYCRPEIVEFAWENLLKQDKVSPKDKAQAYPGLIEAKLRLRKKQEARQLAVTAGNDADIPATTRLMAALVLIGVDAVEREQKVPADVVERTTAALAATEIDQYNAFNVAAATLRTLGRGRVARQFAKVAEALIEQQQPSYLCHYLEQAPLGAGGWLGSSLLDNEAFRESRFRDYSQKAAAALVTDVNAERATSAKGKNKAYYFDNTAFYMAYDLNGWHIFVLCGEANIEKLRLDGGRIGALEMSFAPTPESTYYQWIINQADGKTDTYDWSSPNRSFRPARDYIKTETRISGDRIGTYIFFPWEMVYDKLPFGTGQQWLFEVIRWSPAGGVSWSGGRVHNTGKWGRIEWQPPSAEQLSMIRKNLLRKAWSKYKATRKRLVDDYWASRDFGDPGFLRDALMPEVERLDNLGKAMADPEVLGTADIDRLYREAISDWMEFEYHVSELRRNYLTQRLTVAATEDKP